MKSPESEADSHDEDDQNLEHIHRTLFDHPDIRTWDLTRSLAQPSFLKQIESHSSPHCRQSDISSPVSEKQ